MQNILRLRACLILLICLPFILSSCVQERVLTAKHNHNQIKAVFFQPWENYLEENDYDWNDIFQHLNKAHINQIIIQWSQYGDENLLNDESDGNLFDNIISAAKRYNIKIIFGLYQDPYFFKKIESRTTNIPQYLDDLKSKSINIANQITVLYGNDSIISGFYIPQEIDNLNWQTTNRINALTDFLHDITTEINTNTTTYPVYVSGFYNLTSSIKDYASMWQEILQQTSITVLLQNGVGANAIPNSVCIDYFNIFNTYLPKGKWGIIAELFVHDQTDSTKFICAKSNNIQQSINEYEQQFPGVPIYLFSLSYLQQHNYELLKAVSHP